MPKRKPIPPSADISSLKHKDKRVNIPTEELRGFMVEEEKAQYKPSLYPRDTSLGPQPAWRGKDEQDAHPLEVPVVPIYIQEKIHPQAIIENLRQEAKKNIEPALELFGDFNGIKFNDMVDFYHHEQNWSNRMILGDSLPGDELPCRKRGDEGESADDLH